MVLFHLLHNDKSRKEIKKIKEVFGEDVEIKDYSLFYSVKMYDEKYANLVYGNSSSFGSTLFVYKTDELDEKQLFIPLEVVETVY